MLFVRIFQVFSQIGQVEQLHYAYQTSVALNGAATELGIHCDCAASFPSEGYPRDPLEVSHFSRGNLASNGGSGGSWFLSAEDFLRFRAAWLPYLDRLSAASHEAVPQRPWALPHHWQQHGTCPTKAEKELHVPKILPRCPRAFFLECGGECSNVPCS